MKKIALLFVMSLALLTGCQEPQSSGSGNGSSGSFNFDSGDGGDGNTTGETGSTDGTNTTAGSGTTCYGTAADGDGNGSMQVLNYPISLAGHKDWVPVNTYTAGMLTIDGAAQMAFTSDSRLRFRLKMEAQPTSCPYKESGASSYPYYTKLRYTLKFHTYNSNQELVQFHSLPNQEPVDVNSCSKIYTMAVGNNQGDFPNPATTGPIFVSVHDVKTDFDCQATTLQDDPDDYYYSWFCPAESLARSESCWKMTLQVVNDGTDDFR
ncbi:MAG: hypothetical protein ACI9QD_000725 [Thermoproteota archaeon]|jgi:hypothetical protein